MRATFRLLNNYFWQTMYGPILAFIFPTALLGILGNIMRIEYVFPGILAITSLFIAVQSMPLGLMEMKNSTLFKYIGSAPIDSRKFTAATILYYIFINFFAITLLMIMGVAIFHNKVFPKKSGFYFGIYSGIFTPLGFFSFLCANLLHIFLSLAIGILIATLSKTPQQALTIALIIIIPSMFLSGMVLSVDIIAQSRVMQWVSRFVPFRYTTGNLVVATTPSPQIGDLMTLLTTDNKKLIFNIVGEIQSDGRIHYFDAKNTVGLIITQNGTEFWQTPDINVTSIVGHPDQATFTAKAGKFAINIYDMKKFYYQQHQLWDVAKTFWFQSGDSTLFKNIFMGKTALVGSDNNMFNWTGAFGVRKIPSVEAIQSFIEVFFKGESVDTTRFIFIWDNFINAPNPADPSKIGNYSFLDLFMKQNVVLYTLPGRILNFFIPVVVSVGSIWFSMKKFAWSAR